MAAMAAMTQGVCTKAAAPSRRSAARRNVSVRAAAVELPAKYTKVVPLGERVLVKVAQAEKQTSGGILLAESAQRKPTSGDVVAVGEECKEMKVGVTVLYNKFGIGCTDIEMGGETFIMIREADLIGTFPGSGATANDIPKLIPTGDRVLLQVDEAMSTTKGGIMLTSGAVEKPITGTVLSTGPGKKDEENKDKDSKEVKPVGVTVGQKVLFFKYAGDKMFDSDGKEFVVLYENDILATM
mmetsp:Transcript_33066/g.81321  ORF Transcript_33066/g.81321 Transcript_33066/m.81321 type:complete len:240 (-) Transcript_33066:128-847(-)